MKPWNEGNFLERLMPQRRRENEAQTESCPDSELLSAFMEDQMSPFLQDAIAAHVMRCPKCQEVYERLGQFAKASVPAQDAEWLNAEKRLDNWMGGFLRARSDEARSRLKVESSKPVPRWNDIPKAALSWKVGWAVVVAALLAFGVASVVLSRRGPAASVQIAERQQARPETRLANPALSENPAQRNDSASGGAQVSRPEQMPHAAIRNNTASQKSPSEARTGGSSLGERKAALPSPSSEINSEGQSQIAGAYNPPPLHPGDQAASGSARGIRMPSASHAPFALLPQDQSQHSSAPRPAAGAVADHPSSFRLEAGTYLWVWLSRTLPNDGIFTFQGSLMLPFVQSGTVLLNPGTEINGAGTMKGGEVATIFVTEINVQGVRYKLQGKAGAGNVSGPGRGSALPSCEGQGLKIKLAAASVYERSSEAPAPARPQN